MAIALRPHDLVYQGLAFPPPGPLSLDAVIDAQRGRKWVLAQSSAGPLELTPWTLNAAARWVAGSTITLGTGGSPSILRLADGSLSLAYVASGSVKHSLYDQATGERHVQTVGTGTLVTHTADEYGRRIVALYNSGWYVSVGTLNSDGVTFTFCTPVSMGLTASNARGSLERLPNGSLEFTYVNGAGTVAIVRAQSIDNSGAGTWS